MTPAERKSATVMTTHHDQGISGAYHAVPRGRPGQLGRFRKEDAPPRHRAVGLCQIDGMPHDSHVQGL